MLQKWAYLPISHAVSVWGNPPFLGGWVPCFLLVGGQVQTCDLGWVLKMQSSGGGVLAQVYPLKDNFCASWVFTLPSVFAPAHFQAGSSALILFRLFSFLPLFLSFFLSFFTALDTFFSPCSTYPNLLSIARTLEPCVAEGMSDSELGSIFV